MTVRRLVFGDDGSAAADVVWLWINSHRWPGWTISVVTARRPDEWTPLPPDRTTLHSWTPPHPRVLFADSEATHLEHLMAEADPRVVLDSAGDAALMAVGPRGRGVLKQLSIGSTTDWLAQRPGVPLVVVRSGRTTARVLLATDGSSHARRAATCLAQLPWLGECDVTVLSVLDGRTDADRAIEEAGAVLRAGGADPRPLRIDLGDRGPLMRRDARAVILDEITEQDVDLVALGTAGTGGGLRRAMTGSTARAVLHHAPCSVLVAYEEP